MAVPTGPGVMWFQKNKDIWRSCTLWAAISLLLLSDDAGEGAES